jgi:transcriptional antiterminator NusG
MVLSDESEHLDQPPAADQPPAHEQPAGDVAPAQEHASHEHLAPAPVEHEAAPPEASPAASDAPAEAAPAAKEKKPAKPKPEAARSEAAPSEAAPSEAAPSNANGDSSGLPSEEIRREWYILKVQSNREDSIRDGLLRRVKMAGLERYFGSPLEQSCIVPTEMITEFKGGKKRISKRKLYPGYLVVNMEINDDTWYLVRETTGIGDFTGSIGRPSPMAPQDVQKILAKSEEKTDEAPKLKISFKKGDRVKINEGTFENFEGDVDAIDEANGRVVVMINIFGRSTPVELEYWQIEAV